MLSRIECIEVAELVAKNSGKEARFRNSYVNFRQFYDITTALEMALEQQELYTEYQKKIKEKIDG